jgi:hypothetical protein
MPKSVTPRAGPAELTFPAASAYWSQVRPFAGSAPAAVNPAGS